MRMLWQGPSRAAYLAFLITIDVPMYLNRWRDDIAGGREILSPLQGLRDASTRWIVTHDFIHWKDEIAWMSLYFTAAVWGSLALCLVYCFQDQLSRYRVDAWTITITRQSLPPPGRVQAGHDEQARMAIRCDT